MTISLLLPTRQRREQFTRFCNSALQTADDPSEVEIVAYVDDDDGSYDGLEMLNLVVVRGPRVVLSEMWNACWKAASGEYFMHCGDDLVFKTHGWDREFTKAIDDFPGKIAFVWGDDLNDESQRNEFGTHGMVHKNWTDVVGYFCPPYFVSDYNDTFFNDLSRKLHVQRYLHHVKTEHMHYSLGKSEIDQNTRERLERHANEHPEEIYNSPKFQAEMEQKREALQAFINKTRGWT